MCILRTCFNVTGIRSTPRNTRFMRFVVFRFGKTGRHRPREWHFGNVPGTENMEEEQGGI